MLNYQQNVKDLEKLYSTSLKSGLTEKWVNENREKYWENKIKSKNKINPWKIFFEQFKSFLILILLFAIVISVVMWEWIDAIVIAVIVILNSILGFVQEYNAEKSIESLKKMSALKAKVIRWWKEQLIDSSELVVWDLITFEAWDKIWADARLIQAMNVEVAEAVLTWESVPVAKNIDTIKEIVPLWDQCNMVFSGTEITKGRGMAIVTNVWMDSEIWKIAWMLQEAPEKQTHLQRDLDALSKKLWVIILIICVVIFLVDAFTWEWLQLFRSALDTGNWKEWLLSLKSGLFVAIALAVAAIPEWLPAVVTIALSIWVKKLVKKNALMRKLWSVETLGAVNVICTDKTWTLTKNEMTVKKLYVDEEVFDMSGVGYFGHEAHRINYEEIKHEHWISRLLKIGLLCNNSAISWKNVIWDPTEVALLVSAFKWWLDRKKEEWEFNLIDEIPFDSDRKLMTTIRQRWKEIIMFTKWAPEMLIDKCSHILINEKEVKITDKHKKKILAQNENFAKSALRVLWFAYKKTTKWDLDENNLVFVWLQAMIDPPRPEVKQSIQECHEAWIRVIMITWDNVITASAIGAELWLQWEAIEWIKLDDMSDAQVKKLLDKVSIFARVSPNHKQRLVKLLKEKGNVVAMTWDGVNDAPALKHADIWVAMWITGTDVSKEASDLILLDDNFSTIVSAIQEWRWIYDNIRKFVNFMFSTNFSEILIIFIASICWMPAPLLAIQILWLNLVTDSLPALALWIDPMAEDIMQHKPRKKWSKILDKEMLISILMISVFVTIWCLSFFILNRADINIARTWVLLLLVILEMLAVFIVRADYWVKFLSNKWLFAAVFGSIGLTLLVVYIPFLAKIFDSVALRWIDLVEMLIITWIWIVWAIIWHKIKKTKFMKKKLSN